jgi:hypothetical protein
MARGPCRFKQRDVERAIRAARSCGVEIARVEIGQDGQIILVSCRSPEPNREIGAQPNEWDAVS